MTPAKFLRITLFAASLFIFIPYLKSDPSEKYFHWWPMVLAFAAFSGYKFTIYMEAKKFSLSDAAEILIFCFAFAMERYVLDHF